MAVADDQNAVVKDPQILSAAYQSPANEAFTSTHTLPAPPSDKTIDRTDYLAALRKAAGVLQERINVELTARMEEDKVRGKADGITKSEGVDEAKEEDAYGEEVPEEE